MVFQDYALFPHLNAKDNAYFGCRKKEDQRRAQWLLEQLGIAELQRRYPHELSGGQRQRLALVRALAPGPQLLLLDEPFSNLDVEVRLRLRSELRMLLAQCGVSAVLVTHDPQEALAVCDRVAVMKNGRWDQYASPRTLVNEPATAFVARFVLQGNVIPLKRLQALPDGGAGFGLATQNPLPEREVLLRQEALAVQCDPDGLAKLVGREFLGDQWLYQFDLHGESMRLKAPLDQEIEIGSRCNLSLRAGASACFFPVSAQAPT
jgi:iron(III) transport system ATP-binding protein